MGIAEHQVLGDHFGARITIGQVGRALLVGPFFAAGDGDRHRAWCGQLVAARHRVLGHGVGSGGQAFEVDHAVGGDLGRDDDVVRVEQLDRLARDVGERALGDIEHAVAILVQEAEHVDRAVAVKAGVDGSVELAGCQNHGVRHCGVRIGRRWDAYPLPRGEHVAVGIGGGVVGVRAGEHHLVFDPGRQSIELVIANAFVARGRRVVRACAGDRAANHGACAVEQLDGNAVDAGLARVLPAVAVRVVPDKVAQLGSKSFDEYRLQMDAITDWVNDDADFLSVGGQKSVVAQREGID